MEVNLDKIDHKILQHLLSDGRASFSTIAKDVKLTDVAIKKRVDRLFRKGVLNSITADINLKVLGYENPIYLQMRTELSKNKDIVKRLREFDHFVEIYSVLGEYNLLGKIVVPNMDSVDKFIERLGTIDGMLDIKSQVVMGEVKRSNSLPSQTLQKKL